MNLNLIFKYFLFSFIYSSSVISQNNQEELHYKYIDSANAHIDNNPKLSNIYLDSIVKPLERNISGRIAEFYSLKAVIASHSSQQTEVYHYNTLALKYAEKEKNYDIAGFSSLELFYNLFIVEKDSSAYDYLEKAEKYYRLENNTNGLAEVVQMEAFAEFYRHNYEKSNALILSKLDYYRAIKNDQYYYMYALFMLTSNYTYLAEENLVRKYFKAFKKLETDTTIAPFLFKKHEVTLYNCLAEMHLASKTLDSVVPYLEKAEQMREAMNDSDKENYFNTYIRYYDVLGRVADKNNYVDSLKFFQQEMIKETVDASFNISKDFIETNQDLELETQKAFFNKKWIVVLSSVLVLFVVLVLVRYKKIKRLLKDFSKRKEEFSFLQTNHEKLKVKVKGMEDYISEVKKEIKNISTLSDINNQQSRVKELYKNIHHNSSTLLSKSEDHLELINELNVEFFNQISNKHSNLNPSEHIVCYYLFMGFKSKEIAVFLNTSTRAVESKRYRISNKLNVKELGFNLTDYLQHTFQSEVEN